MIKADTATAGIVFRDPTAPARKNTFRLTRRLDDGRWQAEPVTTKRAQPLVAFTPEEMERLLPMPQEVIIEMDLDSLIGHRVVFKTAHGRRSGTVMDVEAVDVVIVQDGERVQHRVVTAVLLAGAERIELRHVVELTVE